MGTHSRSWAPGAVDSGVTQGQSLGSCCVEKLCLSEAASVSPSAHCKLCPGSRMPLEVPIEASQGVESSQRGKLQLLLAVRAKFCCRKFQKVPEGWWAAGKPRMEIGVCQRQLAGSNGVQGVQMRYQE